MEKKLVEVRRRLLAKPDSYIFPLDEFALFNYYRSWSGDHDVVMNATKRHWDNYQALTMAL
jgi:hypothetical protein